jgi:hypothetical protein
MSNKAEHRMRTLLANSTALGVPARDLAELVQANMTGNVLESVMRVRALTELSSRLDSTTLIALAAIVTQRGGGAVEIVSAIEGRLH